MYIITTLRWTETEGVDMGEADAASQYRNSRFISKGGVS